MKKIFQSGRFYSLVIALCLLLTSAMGCFISAQEQTVPEQQYVTRVVTIGADLSEEQKNNIFRFFGTTPEEVTVMVITNADERAHLEHLFPSDVIGWQTFSCAYVSPTQDGRGIQVKTANLNYVTGNMIASTLSTSGVENCDVLAAAPFEVSGTGALTGVIMAYEQAIGQELDAEKKELANEELLTTGELANEVGQDEAILVVNDIKLEVIRRNASPEESIGVVDEVLNSVNDAAVKSIGKSFDVSGGCRERLYGFASKYASMGFTLASTQATLQRVAQNVTESTGIDDPIMDTFEDKVSTKIPEDSILYTADDAVFGGNTTATFDDPAQSEEVTFDGNLAGDGVTLTAVAKTDADDWVSSVNLLRYRGTDLYGLADAGGNHLTDEVYRSLNGYYGYVAADLSGGTSGSFGLLNNQAEEIIPFQYDQIDIVREHWAIGFHLQETTEADADLEDYNGHYYRIESADIYYLENDQASLTGSLPREEFGEYYAEGKAINIENRGTGEVSCYNSSLEAVETGLSSVYSSPDSRNSGLIYTFRANGQDGLMDAEGNVILNPSYDSIYVSGDRDYIKVSTGTYEGLIDWDGNEMITPAYDEILGNSCAPLNEYSASAYGYSGNGYVAAVKDGNYVFLDVNGNVTYEPGVAAGEADSCCGASVLYEDASGKTHILAADGRDTVIEGFSKVSALPFASGMLYRTYSEDYSIGLIDWHGNVIFEPKFDRISMSPDGTHLLVNEYYAGSEIFDVSCEGPEYVPVIREKPEPGLKLEERNDKVEGGEISIREYSSWPEEDIKWVPYGNEIIFRNGSPLMDRDGNQLSEKEYDDFTEYFLRYVQVSEETADGLKKGVISTSGDPLIPLEYDEITFLNSHWAIAFVLEETDKDEGDFRNYMTDTYLDIVRADVYHLNDGQVEKSASLSYDEIADYSSDSETGSYIVIQDRSGKVTAYDEHFEVLAEDLNSVYSSVDGVVRDYTSYYDNGLQGVMDAAGNIIIPAAYRYVTVYTDEQYVLLENDDMEGAADLSGRLLVPAEYDKILRSSGMPLSENRDSRSGIISNGYIGVVKDGLIGFYDINGNITAEPFVPYEGAYTNGASVTYEGEDGKIHIYAGDGVDTAIDEAYESARVLEFSAGMLYSVTNEDYDYGVIDWHGNELLPCEYNDVSLSADGRYLIAQEWRATPEIFQVFYSEEEAAAAGPAAQEKPAETAAADADAIILQALEGVHEAALSDFEGQKETISAILSQVSGLLAEEHKEAASYLDSALQLIELDAADAESIALLIETAMEEVSK